VFSAGTDAVAAGLNRSSSNATGISFMVTDLSERNPGYGCGKTVAKWKNCS
jgi:hypothetical protein